MSPRVPRQPGGGCGSVHTWTGVLFLFHRRTAFAVSSPGAPDTPDRGQIAVDVLAPGVSSGTQSSVPGRELEMVPLPGSLATTDEPAHAGTTDAGKPPVLPHLFACVAVGLLRSVWRVLCFLFGFVVSHCWAHMRWDVHVALGREERASVNRF